MQRDSDSGGVIPAAAPDDSPGRVLSRRQALGRMSVVATAGAAAWVVPQIMTAKPAAGASLSLARGLGGGDGGDGPDSPPGVTTPSAADPFGVTTSTPDATSSVPATSGTPGTLAFTGIDIQRDAEIGAALIAGGWAMQHWASRTPRSAAKGGGGRGGARSTDATPT
jgi:hypothetical protein